MSIFVPKHQIRERINQIATTEVRRMTLRVVLKQASGVSQRTFERYLSSETSIPAEIAQIWADTLGISMEQLLNPDYALTDPRLEERDGAIREILERFDMLPHQPNATT